VLYCCSICILVVMGTQLSVLLTCRLLMAVDGS
jgi:hypothetical protein